MLRILSVSLKSEPDIVFARQRARQLAGLLGFDRQDQTRIATAVSEIARNAVEYGGGGCVKFSLAGSTSPQLFLATVSDEGSGIANLEEVLSGRHRSTTGMGVGLMGARRLVDQFSIESTSSGTTVALKKLLPATAKVFSHSDRRAQRAKAVQQGRAKLRDHGRVELQSPRLRLVQEVAIKRSRRGKVVAEVRYRRSPRLNSLVFSLSLHCRAQTGLSRRRAGAAS